MVEVKKISQDDLKNKMIYKFINYSCQHLNVWINIKYENSSFTVNKALFDSIINEVSATDIFNKPKNKMNFQFQYITELKQFQMKCIDTREMSDFKDGFRMNGSTTRLANSLIDTMFLNKGQVIEIKSEWGTLEEDKYLFEFIKRRLSVENPFNKIEFDEALNPKEDKSNFRMILID